MAGADNEEDRRPSSSTGLPPNPSRSHDEQPDGTPGLSQRRGIRDEMRRHQAALGFDLVADSDVLDVFTKRLMHGSYLVLAVDCGGTSTTDTVQAREVVDVVARHLMGMAS